jgi:hypothetical protein
MIGINNFYTMKRLHSLILLLCLGVSVYAQQPVRNTVERTQDRNQIGRDQATLDRDRAELAQFRGYQAGLKAAVAAGDVASAHAQHQKLMGAMHQEIQQSEAKVAGSANEVRQSGSEVRSDTREIQRDRAQGRPVAAAADRGDRRDDRADKADDRGDLAERRARLARQREILATFKAINVQNGGVAAISAKMNLLDEFEQTMVRDMGENHEELREDRGEIREDRQETREDRNHR